MSPKTRNIFLLFGLVAIVVMCYTFNLSLSELKSHLLRISLYLPAVLGVWVVVYAFNARAFQLIVNNNVHEEKHLPFLKSYKLTVSGFAFSYTTPFGFGGGPYRVIELKSFIGVQHAMSSVVLYSMMHILSHFCLWTSAVILYILFYKVADWLWPLFGVFFAVVALAVYFFYYGYRKGLIRKGVGLFRHIPLIKRYINRFYEKNEESMSEIDRQIAYLHKNRGTFYRTLLMEYLARVTNAFEYYFILMALLPGHEVGIIDSILILAFSSLFSNLLFFFPMQLGAREGGLALIIKLLFPLMAPSIGILTSLYTRLRELFWVIVGILLVKIGNKQLMK